jgi:phosphoribosylanthranilate isomerase
VKGEVQVKICGITRPQDALAAAQAGAWAVGLVFYPGSPRCLSIAQARGVAAVLPAGVLRVGVFLDQSLDDIQGIRRALRLDLVQLHGAQAHGICRDLGAESCIQAVALHDEDSVGRALDCQAAYVLLDRARPGGKAQGGPVDWSLASRVAQRRPRTLLAGGLTPDNVGEAIRRASPWGVDVSGGVEGASGDKDPEKIRAFLDAVRMAR